MFKLHDEVEIINIKGLPNYQGQYIGCKGKIEIIDNVSQKDAIHYKVEGIDCGWYDYNLKSVNKKKTLNMYISSQDKVKMIMKYNMSYEDIQKLDITAKKVCNVLINEWYSKKLDEKVIYVTSEIIKGLLYEYGVNNFNDIQVEVVMYKDFLLKRR